MKGRKEWIVVVGHNPSTVVTASTVLRSACKHAVRQLFTPAGKNCRCDAQPAYSFYHRQPLPAGEKPTTQQPIGHADIAYWTHSRRTLTAFPQDSHQVSHAGLARRAPPCAHPQTSKPRGQPQGLPSSQTTPSDWGSDTPNRLPSAAHSDAQQLP